MPVVVEQLRPRSNRRSRRAGSARSGSRRSRSVDLEPGTAGYGSLAHYSIAANMAYIQTVKDALRHQPGAYKEFVQILSEIQSPEADLLRIIDRVVMLLEGQPDLIYSFNAFLPKNYEIEMQEYAVVVKVYNTAADSPARLGSRSMSHERSPSPQKDYGASVGYITAVKMAEPQRYTQFMAILSRFHAHEEDVLTTVRSVVRLLQNHPRLVLGFNAFLPPACSIREHKGNYTIQHPRDDGKITTVKLDLKK